MGQKWRSRLHANFSYKGGRRREARRSVNSAGSSCRACTPTYQSLGAASAARGAKPPVPTVDDYMDMRRAYVAVVGLEESTIPSNPINEHDGYHVGIAAKQAGPHKGRGVFATEFIPQGTTVWSGTQAASFATIVQFRDFLGELARTGTNPYNACDVLDWAYTEYDDDDEDWTMSVELDPAALCNNAVTPDQVNLGCDETVAGGAQACEEAFGVRVGKHRRPYLRWCCCCCCS